MQHSIGAKRSTQKPFMLGGLAGDNENNVLWRQAPVVRFTILNGLGLFGTRLTTDPAQPKRRGVHTRRGGCSFLCENYYFRGNITWSTLLAYNNFGKPSEYIGIAISRKLWGTLHKFLPAVRAGDFNFLGDKQTAVIQLYNRET